MLHAHRVSRSRDCDGPHEHEHVTVVREGEDEFEFEERVLWLASHWPASEYDGPQEIKLSVNSNGNKIIETFQQLEEGHESTFTEICEDELCDLGRTFNRDVYAERMGY